MSLVSSPDMLWFHTMRQFNIFKQLVNTNIMYFCMFVYTLCEGSKLFDFQPSLHSLDVCWLWVVSGLTPGVPAVVQWKLQQYIICCLPISREWSTWFCRSENKPVYCSFIFSYHFAERAFITNVAQTPISGMAETEISLAMPGKSNWMYYDPAKLQ